MPDFNKSDLLLALIAAGNPDAHEFAMGVVKGENNNGTNANLSPAPAKVQAPDAGPTDSGELQFDANELDKRGFPHCPTIHAKTKTKDTKGVWKYAVGIDRENLVPQIEQQLRDQGFGQPEGAAPAPVNTPAPTSAPTPAAPEAVAPAPVAPTAATAPAPGLPPVAGLPPVSVPKPAVVEFPNAENEADMDDDTLIQTAAALAGKHGNEALKKLLALFQVPEGGTAKDIPEGWKFPFWQYATSDEGLRSQSVIS